MSVQKIIIGTITGVLAGVAVGLVVAPAKGSETRQKIADSADDLKNKLGNLTKKADLKLDDLKNIFQNEIAGLGDDVRQKILKLMDSGKTGMNNAREGVPSSPNSNQ